MLSCTVERHHTSPLPRFTKVIKDEADAINLGLIELGVQPQDKREIRLILEDLYNQEKANFSVTEDGTEYNFACWRRFENGVLNFGIGEGSTEAATNKFENIWFKLEEYKPDENRKTELMKLSREELAQRS